jgi:hypothetical protein
MEGNYCKDTEALEQVCSLNIQRVQSSRLRGEGLPEEDELRVGIEAKIEGEKSERRVIGFSPGDPEDPRNWSYVSITLFRPHSTRRLTITRGENGSSPPPVS